MIRKFIRKKERVKIPLWLIFVSLFVTSTLYCLVRFRGKPLRDPLEVYRLL